MRALWFRGIEDPWEGSREHHMRRSATSGPHVAARNPCTTTFRTRRFQTERVHLGKGTSWERRLLKSISRSKLGVLLPASSNLSELRVLGAARPRARGENSGSCIRTKKTHDPQTRRSTQHLDRNIHQIEREHDNDLTNRT